MSTTKEILYFDKPDRVNIDEMIEFLEKRRQELGINTVLMAWSSGYTLERYRETTKNKKVNFVVVTNARGAQMPIVIKDSDKEETKKWKEEQLRKGITGTPISIPDDTREKYEKAGIKVYYVPDYLNFGEPLALTTTSASVRDKLAPFITIQDLRPLDIDAGTDLSILTIISQGFRVAIGCTAVAASNGLIPEGETIVAISGRATGLVLRASLDPKKCVVNEIIGYERNSAWFEQESPFEEMRDEAKK